MSNAKKVNGVKCSVPSCPRGLNGCRGLCASCYATYNNMVRRGTLTWDKLIKAGLCNEAKIARNSNAYNAAVAAGLIRDRFSVKAK